MCYNYLNAKNSHPQCRYREREKERERERERESWIGDREGTMVNVNNEILHMQMQCTKEQIDYTIFYP